MVSLYWDEPQTLNIHSANLIYSVFDQFHAEILRVIGESIRKQICVSKTNCPIVKH